MIERTHCLACARVLKPADIVSISAKWPWIGRWTWRRNNNVIYVLVGFIINTVNTREGNILKSKGQIMQNSHKVT